MNFSDFFNLSSQLFKISKDGTKFANAVFDKIVIRDAENMQPIKVFKFEDTVQHLEWSYDSTMILCANFKRSLIRVSAQQHSKFRQNKNVERDALFETN